MIARKVKFIADHLEQRAAEDAPLSFAEMRQIAAILGTLAELAEHLERQAIPQRLRVVAGGRS